MIAALCANAAALARDPACDAPARYPTVEKEPRDYRPVFQICENAEKLSRLAIRRMSAGGDNLFLAVDSASLATSLERDACWTCADTSDEAQKDTRYVRAVRKSAAGRLTRRPRAEPATTLRDAGLVHGAGEGSFITGDLCPSLKPLDRGFVEKLEGLGPRTPVALSISGLWLTRHAADFEWLRERSRAGAIAITWVNHSWRHPYFRGRPLEQNFMLTPGLDPRAEILETEKLLIAHGETPSVFFRFPGLVSDEALMELVREHHLVTLGADAWLVFSPPLKPGAIVLVHPNGNEPAGLRLFARLADDGALPRPFRAINEAPEAAPEPAPRLPAPPESAIPAPWLTRLPPPILRK